MLPNGPEMAAAFVAIAAGATTAPLNPAYRAEEFEFYLTDLGPRRWSSSSRQRRPPRPSAAKLGMPILRLEADAGAPAGQLPPRGRGRSAKAGAPGPAQPGDIALVLHTSGTTSRPKIVPLTQREHRRLGAEHPRRRWRSTPADRCLNIMPLFHIHGLIAAVLVLALGRRLGRLHAGLQRAEVLPVAR